MIHTPTELNIPTKGSSSFNQGSIFQCLCINVDVLVNKSAASLENIHTFGCQLRNRKITILLYSSYHFWVAKLLFCLNYWFPFYFWRTPNLIHFALVLRDKNFFQQKQQQTANFSGLNNIWMVNFLFL